MRSIFEKLALTFFTGGGRRARRRSDTSSCCLGGFSVLSKHFSPLWSSFIIITTHSPLLKGRKKEKMSGYRTIHRQAIQSSEEDLTNEPTWSLCFSPCNQTHSQTRNSTTSSQVAPLRLLTSSADGVIRAFKLCDKTSIGDKDVLDASALTMNLEQILLPTSNMKYPRSKEEKELKLSLGSAVVSSIRNYVGEDPKAGGEVSAAIRLDGHISIWKREEQPIYPESSDELKADTEIVEPLHEFKEQSATGTTLLLLPPQLTGYSRHGVVMMVGCLDGSVAFICTGVGMPDISKGNDDSKAGEPGMVLDRVGSGSCPMSFAIQSQAYMTFAVGRKNGIIDVYSSYSKDTYKQRDGMFGNFRRCHRLNQNEGAPTRALSYTPDGSLLISGCDDGHIYMYDTSSFQQNESILLVGSLNGHKSFIFSISVLPDSRRFLTSSADKTVKVWDVSAPNSGTVHTFEGNDMIWDVCCSDDGRRSVSSGDDGMIQIYSCDS